MSIVYLLIGGNLGDVKSNISTTCKLVKELVGTIERASSIIESEPWGFSHDNNFLNQVFKVKTTLLPEELIVITQQIEKNLGRVKNSQGYEARTMDIDTLFYDNIIINNDKLIIPHPRLHLRRFTLFPLNEIAGDYIHPILNKSITELLNICEDKSELTILK